MSGINEIKSNSLLSDVEKETYVDRIYKEYLLLKVNEYKMYSAYFSEEELLEMQKLIVEANERFSIKMP